LARFRYEGARANLREADPTIHTDIDTSGVIWDHWRRHADQRPECEAIVHIAAEEEDYRWRWSELMRAASRAARWLSESGVRKGEVCALIVRHNKYFYPLYMGITCLGALPAVLAYPNGRLHPDKFRQGLEGMSKRSGLDHILAEHGLTDVITQLVAGDESTVKDILYPLDWLGGAECRNEAIVTHAAATSDEPCLLQHSSGTTGLQKPVVLSHRAVLEHAYRYGDAIGLGESDKVVSWLPPYHDMGLIAAFYIPLVYGVPLVQLSPMEWISCPALLMEAISRERATLCWLPNFAYNFMADRIREEDLQGVRLDTIRFFINCSEPIRAESHEKFYRRFAPFGLRREALGACYAMAETTFAVTQTSAGREARTLELNRAELSKGNVVLVDGAGTGRSCVSSGVPVSGCAVRIVDESRQDVPAGKVGEITISSVSLFDGYRNYPEKTAEVMADGWYYSGDYGFVHEGEVFVIGRKKDVIIVAGNNIFPEDTEDAVGQVPGVIPGRVVAFGADDENIGTEMLCVIAETEVASEAEKKAMRLAIFEAGMSIDVTISRIYLVPPRWMIKSSAGKPARSSNKVRVLGVLGSGRN
jgi:fatty-acyl-CoA synthase